jgi:F-type H+-transporting ATPase subunit a
MAFMFLLNILQDHGQPATGAAEHGAETAGHAAAHGEHIPWIVTKVNEWLGPVVFDLQSQIMPTIYKVMKIFGPHWPGEGKTYSQYVAEGYLPIPTHVVMFLIVVFLAVAILTIIRGKLSAESPTRRQQTFEVGVEAIRNLLAEIVGPYGLKHFPVIATFGVLILLSNLLGMLPDMISPTANFNVTLALGIMSFLYYNYIGIKENGLIGYLKHFAGPVLFLAPLMFPIEIITNLARILSLSMRLFGNIYGEEQASSAISNMVQWIVPALMMPLGLLTSVLQTFIFMLLSMIYIGEVSHHQEDHGEHAHAPAAAH